MHVDIVALIQDYGYPVVALGTFLEGEAVLLAAGFSAHRGYLSLPIVIAIATLASFCGDQLYFFLGRRYGTAIMARFPAMQASADRMQALVVRYKTPIVLAIRFLYGLRIAGPLAIGMSNAVHWRTFVALNLVGALVWACLVAGIGYLFGNAIEMILKDLRNYELAVGVALVAAVLAWKVFMRRRPGAGQ